MWQRYSPGLFCKESTSADPGGTLGESLEPPLAAVARDRHNSMSCIGRSTGGNREKRQVMAMSRNNSSQKMDLTALGCAVCARGQYPSPPDNGSEKGAGAEKGSRGSARGRIGRVPESLLYAHNQLPPDGWPAGVGLEKAVSISCESQIATNRFWFRNVHECFAGRLSPQSLCPWPLQMGAGQ